MFVFLCECLHCNSQNRRLIIDLQGLFLLKYHSVWTWNVYLMLCYIVDLITSISAHKKQNKKTDGWMLGENHSTDEWNLRVFISSFLFLAFLIYALKEKGLFYDETWWKKYLNVFLVLLHSLSSLCFLAAWFFSLQRPLQVPVTAHLPQRSCLIFPLHFVL